MAELSDRLASLSPAQRTLLEKKLAAKKAATEKQTQNASQDSAGVAEPIAIVGMACRLPGIETLDDYWHVIRNGIETISETPADRWDLDQLYDPDGGPGKVNTRRGGFLDNIDQFDPTAFGVTPREANRMDPQQRLLLEVAWEAMENANLRADQLSGSKTGVFVGIGGADYAKTPLHSSDQYFELIDGYMGTGNALSIAANRVSYVFDLHGPSLAIDTACSSSSIAVHLAIESLRRGECTAALAGGVNVILTPETTIAFSNARMLSPEGRCRPFDAGANGYVRGEGCGLVLLKRLSEAQRDGDPIVAVIRSTATNQDGKTSGISAPNGESQKACLRAAHQVAGVAADDFTYIEAHGTGTPLGDPIEMQALVDLFKRTKSEQPPVYVTSVKANIGHTETVSGIASLIKVALMMQHGEIPAQLHLSEINPHIDVDGSRIAVPTEPLVWQGRQLAGVSSFGFGGANSHIVLEAPVAVDKPSSPSSKPSESKRPYLVKLTAKTASALPLQAKQLTDWIEQHPEVTLAELSHAANTGRSDLPHRAAVVAKTLGGLVAQLRGLADSGLAGSGLADADLPAGVFVGAASGTSRPKVAFLFTGQGAQYAGMGQQLYDSLPVFRKAIDRCDELLSDVLEEPLTKILFAEEDSAQASVHRTIYTQPALFALEYAAAQTWMSWGVRPQLVAGHSVGEYVAAVIAGVVSLEEGVALIAQRARLMQQAPPEGGMTAVFATEATVAAALEGWEAELSIAAVNGPENVVISGTSKAIHAVTEELTNDGITCKAIQVSHAFHSPMMDELLDDFEAFATQATFHKPKLPLAANLTGGLMAEAPTARYWRDHLRGTVRFFDNANTLLAAGASTLLEMGPGTTLLGLTKQAIAAKQDASDSQTTLPTLRRGQPEMAMLLASVAQHYVIGGQVDWNEHSQGQAADQPLRLPNYAFERTRCWIENVGAPNKFGRGTTSATMATLLGKRQPSVWTNQVFESRLDANSPLADHVVQGSIVTPAAAYLEQALAAAGTLYGEGTHAVENFRIQQPMFLAAEMPRRVQTTLAPAVQGRATIEVHSQPANQETQASSNWQQHASAEVVHADRHSGETTFDAAWLSPNAAWRGQSPVSGEHFYEQVQSGGFHYGPRFQVLGQLWTSNKEAYAELAPHANVVREVAACTLHPVLGDALLQTLASTFAEEQATQQVTYLPVGMDNVWVAQAITNGESLRVYARRNLAGDQDEHATGDAWLLREDGTILAAMLGVQLQRVSQAAEQTSQPVDWCHQIEWRAEPISQDNSSDSLSKEAGHWIILGESETTAPFAETLRAAGGQCTVVTADDAFSIDIEHEHALIRMDWQDASHHRRLLEIACSNPSKPLAGVVYVGSQHAVDAIKEDSAVNAFSADCEAVVAMLSNLARRTSPEHGVWLVTKQAQTGVGLQNANVSLTAAPLVGLGRVALIEHADLKPRLLDVDSLSNLAEIILTEAEADTNEQQVAYRNGKRFISRLAKQVHKESDSTSVLKLPAEPYQLRIRKAGSLDGLAYQSVSQRALEPDEVELEVHASALNFSDVLKALGLYPGVRDKVVPLGIETSGVVTRVGAGVTRFEVGDAVTGVAPYAFGSHAITYDYTLTAKPKDLSHQTASSLPIAFLTAHHALVKLAQIEPGERVLIHAGAGGVGLAAIQIAQHRGAEIFATAGSDEKRDYLRSLGIEHVLNSRSLDFADEIRRITKQEGIDVVLNSLPGEAIPTSLGLLRAYGRFLEIGKVDIYQNHQLGLAPFQDNLSYFAIDLDRILRQRRTYVRELFDEVMQHFAEGDYRPTPFTKFTSEQTVDAFRYMSQRKNTGKVVVDFAQAADDHLSETQSSEAQPSGDQALVRADSSYLVTGGHGALGLRLARWLAEQGAGQVVLLSRRPPNDEAQQTINAVRKLGTEVTSIAADVSDFASLQQALASLPPALALRGIIHAAGVLDDGLMTELTAERLRKVLAPKAVGGWNLHRLTEAIPLDFFVLFSSVASVLGSPGQGNYAAANATLDALASLRQQADLQATVINWGPWAESGMATAGGQAEAMASRGMRLLPPDDCLLLMEQALRNQTIGERTGQLVVLDADWSAMHRTLTDRWPTLLADFTPDANAQAGSSVDQALRQKLLHTSSKERRQSLIEIVQADLARVIGVEPAGVNTEQPLAELGIDSLMSLELKNRLEGKLGINFPMAKLLEGPSVTSLAEAAAELLVGDSVPAGESEKQEWVPLVTLKPGQGPPLYLLPSLGGDVSSYRQLAMAFDGPNPVLAFRPRGLDTDQPPHDRIREMAIDYTDAILKHQPSGPYHLAGWSTAGIPAYGVAQELNALGKEIALLALCDTAPVEVYRALDIDDDSQFLSDVLGFTALFSGKELKMTPETLRQLPANERFERAVAIAKQEGLFPAEVDTEYLRRLVTVGNGLIRACTELEPEALDCDLHFFHPTDHDTLSPFDEPGVDHAAAWEGLSNGRFKTHAVEGNHFEMLNGQGAALIAKSLAALMAFHHDQAL